MAPFRRKLNKSSGQPVGKFSSDDVDYTIGYLMGDDQTTNDPADINTTTKFRYGKAQIANSANTFKSTLQSAATADRTVTLPDATTTLAGRDNAETLSNKTIPPGSNNVEGFMLSPQHRIWGGYLGGVATQGAGFLQGITPATVGTITSVSNTNGKFANYLTGSTNGDQAGIHWRATGSEVYRSLNPRMRVRIKTGDVTNVRYFMGYTSSNTQFPIGTGGNPLTNLSGIVFCILPSGGANATNYQIAHNDGDAQTEFTDTGVAKATGVFVTFELVADNAAGGFKYSVNDGAYSSVITSEVPASGDVLYPVFVIETAAAAAKDVYMMYYFIDFPTP